MPSLPSTADPFRDLSLSPPQGSLELPVSPAPMDLALPDSALPGSPELDLPGSLEPQAARASPLDPGVPVLPCRQSPPLWSPNFSLPLLLLWLRPWLVPGGAPVFPWEVPTRSKEYADGPAEYNFEYKVADDEQQNYIARQESRDGDTVTGSYNYVNPAGTLVTVNYEAGPKGFKQETSEQKGAVEMRNVPVGWDGPLAGVDDQAVSSGVSASRSTSTSQSDLIAKILASLQPRITSAVQSAIGQTNTVRVAPRPVVRRPSVVLAPPRVPSFNNRASVDQSGIVSSVISSLSPKISSAVSSALAGSTRRSSVSSRGSPRTQTANSGQR